MKSRAVLWIQCFNSIKLFAAFKGKNPRALTPGRKTSHLITRLAGVFKMMGHVLVEYERALF